MSLTDIERERIKEWAKNKQGYSFPKIDMETPSYFEDCKESMDVTELHFSDVRQLRALLESKKSVIKDKEVDLICAAAVFKRKYIELNLAEKAESREDKMLPDFIYHF